MKVLFVSSGNRNGMSPIVERQADSLKEQGIELSHFIILGRGIKGYIKNIPKLRKELKTNHYDIIHAHYGLCGIISNLAKDNEKLVVSYMGDDLLGSNNETGGITAKSKILVRLNKYYAKKNNYNIVKTELMYQALNLPETMIVPNGVNFNVFFPVAKSDARSKLELPSDKKIILFISNPSRKEKNFPLAQKVVDLLDDKNILLITAFNKTAEELRNYYNAADVFILTSFHEGSVNVVKEAMACNCPIVSVPAGDAAKTVGKTEGCYITDYDEKNIAEKIKQILKTGSRTNGRDQIQHLSSEVIAQKIIEIYKKILN